MKLLAVVMTGFVVLGVGYTSFEQFTRRPLIQATNAYDCSSPTDYDKKRGSSVLTTVDCSHCAECCILCHHYPLSRFLESSIPVNSLLLSALRCLLIPFKEKVCCFNTLLNSTTRPAGYLAEDTVELKLRLPRLDRQHLNG